MVVSLALTTSKRFFGLEATGRNKNENYPATLEAIKSASYDQAQNGVTARCDAATTESCFVQNGRAVPAPL